MGVSGFFELVESDDALHAKNCDVFRYAAEEAPASAAGDKLLVVDLRNIVREIYGGDLDFLCGGQHDQFRDRVAAFADKFARGGVRLVFVDDGLVPEAKAETWLRRQTERMGVVRRLLDVCHEGKFPERNKRVALLPYLQVEKTLKSLGCEVVKARDDGDLLAATVARNRGAFGVMAYDSDYFFFPAMAGIKLFSNKDRSLYATNSGAAVTTTMYDPDAVCRHLGLRSMTAMPVLASMLNTDYIKRATLAGLQSKVMGRGKEEDEEEAGSKRDSLTRKLAELIARKEVEVTLGQEVEEEVDDARLVEAVVQHFYEEENSSKSKLCKEILRSVRTYRGKKVDENANEEAVGGEKGSSSWGLAVDLLEGLHASGDGTGYFLAALGYSKFYGTAMEDYHRSKLCKGDNRRIRFLPPSYLVSLPLRRALYGFVLHGKPPPASASVREWAVYGPKTLARMTDTGKPFELEPRRPPDCFPGLLSLRRRLDEEDDDDESSRLRWRLFAWALFGERRDGGLLDGEALRGMDRRDLATFCVLALMTRHRGHWSEDCVMRGLVSFEPGDDCGCECPAAGEDADGMMEDWEVRAFVCAHFHSRRAAATRRKRDDKDAIDDRPTFTRRPPDPRAVHLASTFGCIPLVDLDVLLGGLYSDYDFWAKYDYFDGVTVQDVYRHFRDDPAGAWNHNLLRALTEEEADAAEAMAAYLLLPGRRGAKCGVRIILKEEEGNERIEVPAPSPPPATHPWRDACSPNPRLVGFKKPPENFAASALKQIRKETASKSVTATRRKKKKKEEKAEPSTAKNEEEEEEKPAAASMAAGQRKKKKKAKKTNQNKENVCG